MTPTPSSPRKSQRLFLTEWLGRTTPGTNRPGESPPAQNRSWSQFASAVVAAYAGLLRLLLILLVTSHCLVLFVLALRSAEWAWGYVLAGPSSLESHATIAILVCFAILLAARFCVVTAALLTPRHDAADELIEGTILDSQRHAALFIHVGDVARRVGAPVPHEIWVSEEARCFAFEQRRFGFSTHRILVLVLGLPHLLILRSDELAVIVAHELSHFRQQDTTLALFFFRFSESLRSSLAAVRANPIIGLNPAIWLEWVSYQIFSLLIAPVQRGQEIAADCRSAEAFGGDVARRTLIREWFIASRFEAIVEQRLEDASQGKDHDPRTIYEQFLQEWQEVSASAQQFLRERLEDMERESYWDSHPSLKARLDAVSAYPNFGTDPDGPASGLVGNLPELVQALGHTGPSEAETDTVKMDPKIPAG